MKILVTGGVRSGKSRYAQIKAESLADERVFLATAQPYDDEMKLRISRHQADRGEGWSTLEESLEIGPCLHAGPVVLLDCLTLWISNLLMEKRGEEAIEDEFRVLLDWLARADNHVILVTNEVGFGVVPPSALGRQFRDLSGRLSQLLAAQCDEVVLICAGLPLQLKG